MKLTAKTLFILLLSCSGLFGAVSATNQSLVVSTNNGRIANFTNFFAGNTNLSVPTLEPFFKSKAEGGVITLNTLSGTNQTFATGTTGSDFGITSSGTTHTFNLPTASALTRGLLSGADWTTFNSKAAASHTHSAADITSGTIDPARLGSGTSISTKYLRGDSTWQTVAGGGGDALVANPLSQFAATTSSQLRGVISDETGSGAAVFADSPSLTTPILGVANAISINASNTATGDLSLTSGRDITITSSGATVGYVRLGNNAAQGNGFFAVDSGSYLGFSSASANAYSASKDVTLYRDAANTLALRNATAAQSLRIYNTYSDASNFERGVMDWGTSANILTIGTQKGGTGSDRGVNIVCGGSTALSFSATGDIATFKTLASASYFGFGANGFLTSGGDGVIGVYNNAGTSFNRIQFGGTTASFPSLKRSSTAIQVRLADDSGLAPLDAGAVSATTLTLTGAISFPAGVRQTLSPNSTTPGLNVGSVSSDPSSLSNGDVWLNSTSGRLRTRLGGASVDVATGAQQDFELTTVTSGATIAIDLNANQYQTLALATDATTVTTSNRSATKGRAVTLFVLASGAQRTFTLNGSWRNYNGGSTSVVIPSGKEAAITLFCTGSAETDVRVSYTVQP